MERVYDYFNLPYDLSGSMAKNRFRNEMLWGLKRIYELHKGQKDYAVIFDYVCDVEVHLDDNFEFYQLKTKMDNEGYDIKKLLAKGKTGKSILGKLYILKYGGCDTENEDILLAIVSNSPLVIDSKSYNRVESIELESLDSCVVEEIKTTLNKELSKDKISLKNTYFIRTSLDLIEPNKTLIGETILFFEQVFGYEPKKAASLYRVLESEVVRKACYELEITDYDDLISKKGITKGYLDGILEKYIEKTDIAVEKARDYIKEYSSSYKKKIELLTSLSSIITKNSLDKWLIEFKGQLKTYIKENIDKLPSNEGDIIEYLINTFKNNLQVDYDVIDLEVLSILVLKEIEESVNE